LKSFQAYFSISTSLIFLAVILALLFLAPEIDAMQSGISFYALTDYILLIGIALTLIGLSGISLAAALWKSRPTLAGRTGLGLLIGWGIASVLAGIFPLDPPGVDPTLSGAIHSIAGLNFLLVAPAALLIELTRPALNGSTRPRLGAYLLAWLLLISAILLFVFNGPLYTLGIGGLVQRLYWLILALWLLFEAQKMLGRAGGRRQA
jgi:hypothetical protein